jgi:glutathione reductase (NADPH)
MLVQAAHFEGGPPPRTPCSTRTAARRTTCCRRRVHRPDYAGVGLTEAEARARDPQCIVAVVNYTELDRAVIDDRTPGFLKLISDRRRELILGAHAVGENAIEVVQSVTTAMAAGSIPRRSPA